MSGTSSAVTLNDVPAIAAAEPPRASPLVKVTLWLLVLLGALTAIRGIFGADPRHMWLALQTNVIYWLMLSAASSCCAAMFHVSAAEWSRPVRRIFQASFPFFVISSAALGLLYFGRLYLFVWASEGIPGKEIWLNSLPLYVRDVLLLLVLAYLAWQVIVASIRADLKAAFSELSGIAPDHRWSKLKEAGQAGDAEALSRIKQLFDRRTRLSPLVIAAYAVVMTVISIDQIMSIDPHWYSTLFGALIFMSAVYLAFAWAGIWQAVFRDLHPLYRAKISRATLHDIGKLLFGFGIFWAYMFWSHYLPIWYGNIPEETQWVILRLREEPWHSFAWTTFGLCFLVPFFLGLSRNLKQVPMLLFATGLIVAVGLWFQTYLLLAPTLYPRGIPLDAQDLIITLAFFAAYTLSVFWFLGRYPLIPFGDLYLPKEED